MSKLFAYAVIVALALAGAVFPAAGGVPGSHGVTAPDGGTGMMTRSD